MAEYRKRIANKILKERMETFGAVLIDGPKGCGKTTTAKQIAKSVVEFEDEDVRDGLLMTASVMPSKLLAGETPILFDEWQDAPKIWGAVRKSVDDLGQTGLYLLTRSSSRFVDTPHTGTGRISTMTMLPLSLYESGESNGQVSLRDLFARPESFDGCVSDLSVDGLIYAICRGGWPGAVFNTPASRQLEIAKDMCRQIYTRDISKIDNVGRSPDLAKAVLRSYARNVCTLSKTISGDVAANHPASDKTINAYISALKKIHVVEDIPAWCPAIRSKTTMRSAVKHNFIDPSIAVAALDIGPEYFNRDFNTLGFLFETLCIRDLKIYSSAHGCTLSHYRDRFGLEADCVLHTEGGRYALIEFKLGSAQVEDGARHLCKLESLIKARGEENSDARIAPPDLKIVITATKYGFKRDDGVFVIPIGCLKD
ncbi:MAG: DUF4143 domain-containing protein [Clostridia bacterium]|nr:DUF4143 domain-containing protein [Clostridia bacterium]